MTDNEMKHFLALKEKVDSALAFWVLSTTLFLANAYFQFYVVFGVMASLFISFLFAYNAFLSFLKGSQNDKSYALIEKLINKDSELVKQLNRCKDV